MTNETKTVKKSKKAQESISNVIMGLGLFAVVLSIAYSSTVIVIGTDDIAPKVLIAPQVIFASWIAVKKFTNNKGE